MLFDTSNTNLNAAINALEREYSGELCAGRGDPVGKHCCLLMAERLIKDMHLSYADSAALRRRAEELGK